MELYCRGSLVKSNEDSNKQNTFKNPLPGESYADKASVIVVKKKTNGPAADMEAIHNIAVQTNAAISKAYTNKFGDTVVVCENQESKNSMLPALNNTVDKEKYAVLTPDPRLPTITIVDMPRDYTKDELLDRVKGHNVWRFTGIELDESNFNIIKTKQQVKDTTKYKAIVRVSDEVRRAIDKSGDRLNIGLASCRVFDNLYVKRCNLCQQLNHWKKDCPETEPVCGKCSGTHETRTCQSPTAKCINCVRAKHPNTNHETSSSECPTYMEAQKKLESTINYYKHRKN